MESLRKRDEETERNESNLSTEATPVKFRKKGDSRGKRIRERATDGEPVHVRGAYTTPSCFPACPMCCGP